MAVPSSVHTGNTALSEFEDIFIIVLKLSTLPTLRLLVESYNLFAIFALPNANHTLIYIGYLILICVCIT